MSGPAHSSPAQGSPAADAAAQAVSEQDLLSIVGQVGESLLGAQVEPRDPADGGGDDSSLLTAEVRLTGAWTGAVTVVAPRAAAERMAATMLALPAGEEPEQVDVEDAFGEVVNVLGGSIKALLPAPSALSLPSVVAGPAPDGGHVVREVVAGWAGAGVRVSLRAHEQAPAPTTTPAPAPEAAQEQP